LIDLNKTCLKAGNDTNIQIPLFLKFEISSTPQSSRKKRMVGSFVYLYTFWIKKSYFQQFIIVKLWIIAKIAYFLKVHKRLFDRL